MRTKAIADATPWVAMAANGLGSQSNAPAHRLPRLLLRERDAKLGGGDIAPERLYRPPRKPSVAIPRGRQLIEAGAPRADQGELGRDEEGVRQNQDDDGREAEGDRRR